MGYERGKSPVFLNPNPSFIIIVLFKWDKTQSSQAVKFESSGSVTQLPTQASGLNSPVVIDNYEDEYENEFLRPVTVTVSDGNTFKTVVGDQPMTPGGRYFFELRVNAGYLIKIGICRKAELDVDKVSVLIGAIRK